MTRRQGAEAYDPKSSPIVATTPSKPQAPSGVWSATGVFRPMTPPTRPQDVGLDPDPLTVQPGPVRPVTDSNPVMVIAWMGVALIVAASVVAWWVLS